MTSTTEAIPPEPAVETLPKILRANRKINGQTWLAGVGPRDAKIMFVTPCVLEEEAKEEKPIGYGRTIPRTPRMMDSPHGIILKDIALRNGIDMDKCFVTSVIKYLPENLAHRTRPKKGMLYQCMPLLEADIEEIKPDIIVCLGKTVFDLLVDFKAREDDVYGAWFYNKKFNCRIYPMPHISQVMKPERRERFNMDFGAVKKMADALQGIHVPVLETNYTTIYNSFDLKLLMLKLECEGRKVLSVDCEWEGQQHVDGKLRSLQICWEAGQAAYIRFMDENLNYVFDVSYEEAGKIMAPWCNRPDVKYIGHHVSADLAWMAYWLRLDWYDKAIFDTEFALQCCDESLDLGLDALALRYTDLGKYDWDLIWYRKTHPDRRGNGYGMVPDEIIIPYGCKDVDTVMRAYPIINDWLNRQGLTHYYNKILNPFVTNVFTSFCIMGIPMDRQKMDEMRELYNWAKEELQKDFQKSVAEEAEKFLMTKLFADFGDEGLAKYHEIYELAMQKKTDKVREEIKNFVGADKLMEYDPYIEHFIIAPEFNIRSKPQMARWLFEVKKYVPVKTTANKAAGMPAISWEKVLEYPPAKQKTFTPASDKQTLEILAAKHSDPVLNALLELNAVGNICKAFLKEAEIDEDTGEVIAEKGLHYWVASDNAAHLMHSCTETGRPRSWNPNVLNWPSWIHARLGAGMVRIIATRNEQGQLPPQFKKYVGLKAKFFPTIRSIVTALPGWCVVEADYQTAEMRGLAYISGDQELIDLIEKPDPRFAKVKPEFIPEGVDPEDCVCRLSYPSYISNPPNKEDYIMTYAVNGEIIARFTEDMLVKDENGNLVGPKYDMHWGTIEIARKTAREVMDKKQDRGAGKVGNFSSAYGASPVSIERKIEADIGCKPPSGTGQAILDAIEQRQARATAFLKEMETVPEQIGYLRAASGRIRHCHTLAKGITGLSARTRDGQITALGRECRNFPMQESVGATSARACCWLLDFRRATGLEGYPMVCLYDSVVVHCPVYERAIWMKALRLYMFLANGWQYSDRILRYPIDTELNGGWSTKASKELAERLHNPEWEPTPEKLKPLESWLDSEAKKYESNPTLSVHAAA